MHSGGYFLPPSFFGAAAAFGAPAAPAAGLPSSFLASPPAAALPQQPEQRHRQQASRLQLQRSLGRRCFHFLGTRMMDRHDRLVAPVREIDQLHASGQRNVRQALDVVDLHRRQVDLEELRQVLRQAHDLHEVQQVGNHAALRLHARRARRALEVQRDRHADVLVLQHALQVHVQDLVLRRMALHVLDDRSLRLVLDLERQDRREESLVHQQRQQVLVIEEDLARLVVPAVEDRRYFPGSAQAAARTLPLHAVTRIGDQFK